MTEAEQHESPLRLRLADLMHALRQREGGSDREPTFHEETPAGRGPRGAAVPEETPGEERTLDFAPAPPRPAGSISSGAGRLVLPATFGDYLLERELGRGGMGVVYLARQQSLNRVVAVKMIRDSSLASEVDVQRLLIEARAAAALRHPHIVDVYEVGELEGRHFFSMSFIAGGSLADLLEAGPIDWRVAADLLLTLARTLQFAHERGVVHRDLKPANVLVDEEGRPYLTDFGLAKVLGDNRELTSTGYALGTPSYMPPEQADGRASRVGPAADIYSLGAILYALLTGRPPFRGENVLETIYQVVHDPPAPPRSVEPGVPRDLEVICLKCLEKTPAARYGSAAELADDLERSLHGEPVRARPAPFWRKAASWTCGIPLVAALTGRPARTATPWQRRAGWLAPLLFTLAMLLPWWAWSFAGQLLPREIVLAAGQPRGMYTQVATHLEPPLRQRTGRAVTVRTTEGSVENVELLLGREAHLGFVQADALTAELAVAAPLYDDVVHVIARRGSGIASLADLRGRRVALGRSGSGMRASAIEVLRAGGLTAAEVRQHEARFEELLADTTLEGAIAVTRRDHPQLRELLADPRFELVGLAPEEVEELAQGMFHPYTLRARDYPPNALPTGDAKTVSTTAFVTCRRDAPDALVEALLDILYGETGLAARELLLPPEAAGRYKLLPWHRVARRRLLGE